MKSSKSKIPQSIRKFQVQILNEDCALLFLNKKESELLHQALVCMVLTDSSDHKEISKYRKLIKKIEKQLGL